jgi:hypothetical protein
LVITHIIHMYGQTNIKNKAVFLMGFTVGSQETIYGITKHYVSVKGHSLACDGAKCKQ